MSNAYDSTRGNVTDRQRRKEWLLETYAADVVIVIPARFKVELLVPVERADQYREDGDTVLPCCRCYRCGKPLTIHTLTVDRRVPGSVKTKRYPNGGTYCRENIRPSCSNCANKQGGELSAQQAKARRQVPVVRSGVPVVAARDAQPGRAVAGTVPVPGVQAPGAGGVRRDGALVQ